jgi:hypothetical protein
VGGVHFWWVSVVRDFGGPIVMDVILVVGFIRCTDVLDGVGGGLNRGCAIRYALGDRFPMWCRCQHYFIFYIGC